MVRRAHVGRSEKAGGAASAREETPGEALLCVANFPANTGYAWDFIEGLYSGVADRLAGRGVATWVAYPRIEEPPRTLRGSAARPVELELRLDRWSSLRAVGRFIRRQRVRVVYLADRPAWHPAYFLFRLWGVRRVTVHDHTSGERTVPRGLRRAMKLALSRVPGFLADEVLAVSDYVARRKVEVDLVPRDRVRRLWNSLVIPEPNPSAAAHLRAALELPPGRPVVVCACRSTPEKGVAHLLRAFDRVVEEAPEPGPLLVYMGAGPGWDELRSIRDGLRHRDDVILAGYRSDAADLLQGADLCVVPSVWHEAFGLSALEPMARGVPVVASSVGGIPEVILEGETGLLVPPGDEVGLARAIVRLLADPAERARMGERGRRRAAEFFSREQELEELAAILAEGFSGAGAEEGGDRISTHVLAER